MFLAWNEIKRNKLKFSLIIGVLIMISYLLFLLSGLASGLMNMNREGIDKWQADAIVLNKDANETVEQSSFNKDDVRNTYDKQTTLKQTGVIASNGNAEENALLFGVTSDSFLVPDMIEGKKVKSDNEVVADETLKDKGFKIGDKLYSLYKNNAINYDLVNDNSEKMQKLTKYTNLDKLLILLESMNEEELKNDK